MKILFFPKNEGVKTVPAELIVKILLAVITVGVSIHIYRSNHMLNQKKHEQELKNRILDSYLEHSPESIQDKGFLLLQHSFFDYSGKNVDPEALMLILRRHTEPNLFNHLAIAGNYIRATECGAKFERVEKNEFISKHRRKLALGYLAVSMLIFGYPFYTLSPELLNRFGEDPNIARLFALCIFYLLISIPLFHSTQVAARIEGTNDSIRYLTNQANN